MIFRINSNIASLNAQRHLSKNSVGLDHSIERLSSGLRINRSADDAAGLYLSESLRSQLVGLKQISQNAGQAAAMVQTAESGYEEIGSILNRLKELAIQAQDGTIGEDDREIIQTEAAELVDEIGRIAEYTTYNGINLLNEEGGEEGEFTFPMGTEEENKINIMLKSVLPSAIPEVGNNKVEDIDLTDVDSMSAAIGIIDAAIDDVNSYRSDIGAFQNRIEYATSNLNAAIENTMASDSVIRDADVAVEIAEMTRAQILVQTGTSMLGQANMMPQNALSLLP